MHDLLFLSSIIPKQPKMRHTGEKPVDPLILSIFPGESGLVKVYEDQGNSLGYKTGECSWTSVRHKKLEDGSMKVEILPVEGSYTGMLKARSYEIRLPLSFPPEKIICNGNEILFSRKKNEPGWEYNGDKLISIVRLPKFDTDKKVEVRISFSKEFANKSELLENVPGKMARYKRVMPLLNSLWTKEWSPDILIAAAQTGNRVSIRPENVLKELEKFHNDIPEIERQVTALKKVNRRIVEKVLAHLKDE